MISQKMQKDIKHTLTDKNKKTEKCKQRHVQGTNN